MLSGTVTVARGDTLGRISAAALGAKKLWPSLWWVNRHQVPDPDAITPGEVLVLPRHPAVPGWLGRAAQRALPHVVVHAPTQLASGQDHSNATVPSVGSSGPVSTTGMAAFEACVIQRESGGSPQVMNASGHYGLFQFSASTWAAHGGNPADFGHATVAEQEQVFASTYAEDGTSDWAPYDGC